MLLIIWRIISCQALPQASVDVIAEKYLRLTLATGHCDADFVDAYFGPEEWNPTGEKIETLPAVEDIGQASAFTRRIQ